MSRCFRARIIIIQDSRLVVMDATSQLKLNHRSDNYLSSNEINEGDN